MITFDVSPVTLGTERLPTQPFARGVETCLGGPVEACGGRVVELVDQPTGHPFLAAAHRAFAQHYPLVLRPDDIWLLIVQGLANHVRVHAEELRHLFVAHEGKLEIKVRRNEFVPGNPDNPWPEVFSALSQGVEEHIGPLHEWLVADFSTTTPLDRTVSEIALLDTLQHYFHYVLYTVCGIPSIHLEGTPADWIALRERAQLLAEFGLKRWADALDRVLQHFVSASEGFPNTEYWRSFYHLNSCSGLNLVSGHVCVFFPYLGQTPNELRPSSYLDPSSTEALDERSVPSSVSFAPLFWDSLRGPIDMQFFGGFLGISQDPDTLAVRPEVGWAIRPAPVDP